MEYLNEAILKLLLQGGMGIVVFVIWYITFINAQKQYKDFVSQQLQMMEMHNKQITEHNKQQMELASKMLRLVEDDVKYKEILTGLLARIDLKLDMAMKGKHE